MLVDSFAERALSFCGVATK